MNYLMDISFTNKFSHSGSCAFTLLMVTFAVQKLFCLINICLFICFSCSRGHTQKEITNVTDGDRVQVLGGHKQRIKRTTPAKISKKVKQVRFIKPKIGEQAISDQRMAPFCQKGTGFIESPNSP